MKTSMLALLLAAILGAAGCKSLSGGKFYFEFENEPEATSDDDAAEADDEADDEDDDDGEDDEGE